MSGRRRKSQELTNVRFEKDNMDKTTQGNKMRHEFKVVIEGFELPQEFVAEINKALQKTVLAQIASADLSGKDVVFTPVMGQMVSEDLTKATLGPGGSTGGIAVRSAIRS